MKYEIRKAVVSDAPAMAELRITMRLERETVPPPEDRESFACSMENWFRQALADGSFISFLAVTPDGTIAAMSGLCLENHPPTHFLTDGRFGVILNMYTAPEHRKQGLAGQLLHALMDEARKMGLKRLTLNASAMGRPLYLKTGFQELSGEMFIDL